MHPGNVATITSAGVDVCCLANNHVLDWKEKGLVQTLDVLHGAGERSFDFCLFFLLFIYGCLFSRCWLAAISICQYKPYTLPT
jgi:hypothetical protein